MSRRVSFPYSEVARVYSESGKFIGTGHFRGRASRRDEGSKWSWKGALTSIDFDARAAADVSDLRIEFEDGTSGDAVYLSGYGSGGMGWDFVEVQGRGMPPRA